MGRKRLPAERTRRRPAPGAPSGGVPIDHEKLIDGFGELEGRTFYEPRELRCGRCSAVFTFTAAAQKYVHEVRGVPVKMASRGAAYCDACAQARGVANRAARARARAMRVLQGAQEQMAEHPDDADAVLAVVRAHLAVLEHEPNARSAQRLATREEARSGAGGRPLLGGPRAARERRSGSRGGRPRGVPRVGARSAGARALDHGRQGTAGGDPRGLIPGAGRPAGSADLAARVATGHRAITISLVISVAGSTAHRVLMGAGMLRSTTTTYIALIVALAGCAPVESGLETAEDGAEFVEDGLVVAEGKEDDFLSATAREFVIAGTDQVVLEPEYATRSAADRLARAQELVSLRQIALAWFLNQYLVDKESEEANAQYGGFGAMAKANDYESMNVREVAPLTYAFDFEQLVAGRVDLMTRLPTRPGPDATHRLLTLTVGLPTNAEMARLETNSEWYRSAPWSEWNPTTVSASQRRDLQVTIRRETESRDAWFDYQRLFEDGVLDIDVHFGWDYHDAYHVQHARALFSWLKNRGFRAPVESFEQLDRTSGAFTRNITANGRTIRVEVRIFYGKTGSATDPDTAAGGRQLEADMRDSLRARDVIVYSGHSGPFYGFALANWRRTEEGDLDDSEMASVEMPSDRYQIVVAEGCDTYQIGAAFAQNPAHPELRGLDVITTTSFSNAGTPATVQDFISRLIERDSRGRHRPRTVRSLLEDLDANGGYGFHTMYGIHGVDDDPRLHPYADREMMGELCSVNADCGSIGNLCVRTGDGSRRCTAVCTSDDACGEGMACRPIASASARAIYGSACAATGR